VFKWKDNFPQKEQNKNYNINEREPTNQNWDHNRVAGQVIEETQAQSHSDPEQNTFKLVKDDIASDSLTPTYSAVSPAEGSYD
jgi:hypothetical protein